MQHQMPQRSQLFQQISVRAIILGRKTIDKNIQQNCSNRIKLPPLIISIDKFRLTVDDLIGTLCPNQ